MPTKGVRVDTGYIEIRPELAAGWNKTIATSMTSAMEEVGDRAGIAMGERMSRRVENELKRVTFPMARFQSEGNDAGTTAGKAVKKKIEEQTGKVDVGGKGGKGFNLGPLAGIVSVGAIGVGLKDAADAASDWQEQQSKANVVFGDSASILTAFNENSAKMFGMSKREALTAESTYGALFRTMGIGPEVAAQMSTGLTKLGGDLASFNNAPVTDVLDAMRSGLSGEMEPMKRFGVDLSETRLKAEALRMGLVHSNVSMADVNTATVNLTKAEQNQSKAMKEHGANSIEYADATAKVGQAQEALEKAMAGSNVQLTQAEKSQAAYGVMMASTTLQQDDFQRTAESTANKNRTAAGTFDDLKVKLGEMLLPIENTILDKVIGGLDWLQKWWDEHGPGIQKWFTDTFGVDPGANFSNGLQIIQDKLTGIKDWWVENVGTWDDFQNGLTDLKNGIQAIGDWWTEHIGTWDDFVNGLKKLGDAGKWVKDHFLDPIAGFLQESVPKLGESFGLLFSGIKDHIIDPWVGIMQTIYEWYGKVKDNDLLRSIASAIGVPGMDQGGVVPGPLGAPQLILAHGGETVLPTHRPEMADLRGAALGNMGKVAALNPVAASRSSGPLVQTGDLNFYGGSPQDNAVAARTELRRLAFFAA